MNKIWVLTYTIGTNQGRKQRRLTCDTKEQALMQKAVLGGEVVEYLRQPESFVVNWQSDNAEHIKEVIERLNKSQTWQELYCCRVEPETEEDRDCAKVQALNNLRKLLNAIR